MMSQQLAVPQVKEIPNCERAIEQHICNRLLIAPEHQKRVERIARKYTRSTLIAWEDAAQAAHEKVLKVTQAGKFRQGGVEEFYHWAATVARFEIIDHVRKHNHWNWESLDQLIPGTNLPLSETLVDEFNLLDTVERADLVLRAIEAIAQLDRCYPDRGYLKLWQGQVQEKNQSQLATELGVTQGAISKRWKELTKCLAQALNLLQIEGVKQELEVNRQQDTEQISGKKAMRARSQANW